MFGTFRKTQGKKNISAWLENVSRWIFVSIDGATALNISGIIRDMPVSQHTHSIICFGCLVNPRKLFVDKCDH